MLKFWGINTVIIIDLFNANKCKSLLWKIYIKVAIPILRNANSIQQPENLII